MKLLLLLAYVISYGFVEGQQSCRNLPSLSIIENDFHTAVNDSDQAGNTFALREIFYNCITYASSNGSSYHETTITARYAVEDGDFLGQVLYACVNMNGAVVWVSDDVMLKTGSAENLTERCRDCRASTPTTCAVCDDDCGQGQLNYDCSGCECNEGYTGPTCDMDINECSIVPPVCEGGGICNNTDGSFSCACPTPCIEECNACCSSPCTRGGTCSSNDPDDFTCECPPGHGGERCQEFLGGCHSDPCMNGGMCNNVDLSVDQYRCSCPTGFTGVNCETGIDHCENDPCKNEGWCTSNPSGHTCVCLQGFTGGDCGRPLFTCTGNPTACGTNGECTSKTVGTVTTEFCSCYPGYTGEQCNIIVDNCTNDREPCFHNGMCVPRTGGNFNFSFSCNCTDNWSGFYCTECECEEGKQSDAQCTSCTSPTANPSPQDPNDREGNPDDDDEDATAIIAGVVVAGVAVIAIAVVMVIIAIYFIKKSYGRPRGVLATSWIDSQLTDPFAKDSSMPRFSGSIL